ncbi:hypothetical protein GCM10011533_26190 [Streptosporangium jomthongense]|uniref:DUF6160 family protein n=1 Tax=Marinobacter aromaticivorans TaxID=1494078 RepID=A0ABW2IXX8_9GAMM|nr:DUF6160 family protein [Marinobacter aromaticivorans]GGE72571.1 hypothetical protein GCM10011533_26190 [Streptosporangium jomthongense]
MKGLKKIALATAIAAAPFAANAELQALNDTAMGDVTGQAGVTIELETRVSIGEFTYTDEGTFAVSDIEIGGAATSQSTSAAGYVSSGATATDGRLLDNLKIDIDIADDGDAIIHVGSLQEDANGDPVPIDWGMTAGSMELRGNGGQNTVLVSNLDAWGLLGALDIRVDTDDVGGQAGTGTLNLDAAFTVQEMSFDADFIALGVKEMSINSSEAGGEVLGQAGLVAIFAEDPTNPTPEELRKVGLAQKGFAIVGISVYKGNGLAASTSSHAKTGVLRVDVDDVLMDINVGQTIIGGTNIGTIGIDNLHVSETKLAVYGH